MRHEQTPHLHRATVGPTGRGQRPDAAPLRPHRAAETVGPHGRGLPQYGEADLLRLQQILFFRELDFPLADIQAILDDPGFDQVQALHDHQRLLQQEADRLGRLLNTIEKTISRLTEDQHDAYDG